MNRYRVAGADRVTGAERAAIVEAEDERSAARLASSQHNLFAARITLLPRPPVEANPTANVGTLEYRPTAAKIGLVAGFRRDAANAVERLASARRRSSDAGVPAYRALWVVIVLLRSLAALAVGLALLVIAIGIGTLPWSPNRAVAVAQLWLAASTAAPLLMSALLLVALSETSACMRDAARNSFRQLAALERVAEMRPRSSSAERSPE